MSVACAPAVVRSVYLEHLQKLLLLHLQTNELLLLLDGVLGASLQVGVVVDGDETIMQHAKLQLLVTEKLVAVALLSP